jgi:hypothetical protein
MPKLWRDGRWESVPSIERGHALVHSEGEWRGLAGRRIRALAAVVMVLALATVPTLMYIQLALTPQAVILFAVLLYLGGMLLSGWWHLRAGGAAPGVYERGVEVPWGRFVPYGEVAGTEWAAYLLGRALVLRLRPSGRKLMLVRALFGEDGSVYVEWVPRSAYLADAGREPPRLVVYPSGDAGGSSLERGPRGM